MYFRIYPSGSGTIENISLGLSELQDDEEEVTASVSDFKRVRLLPDPAKTAQQLPSPSRGSGKWFISYVMMWYCVSHLAPCTLHPLKRIQIQVY